ncbi:cysteine desulfurase NifS [Candidatus Parcubacteria bacterium 4484_255]|nr:MAG: cysteine desulfurase NifS [Candidatus Parcubacteria bacterium 4484_255]
MKKIYLDYSATTPVDKRVMKAMRPYFSKFFGNASSLHKAGKLAQKALNDSRKQIARLIGVNPQEIIFTSGGSEADNLALKGIFYGLNYPGQHIITSSIEHHAILNTVHFLEKQGVEVTYLPVDKSGFINPIDVEKRIKPQTTLISIMHANNEMGAIQPLKEIGEIVKKEKIKRKKDNNSYPIYFHTDAVQSLGHIPFDAEGMGIDLFSASAHKLYGPKGVGMLYVKNGVKIESLIHGGAHERGRRASTENIPGVVGFAKALELAYQEMDKEVERLTQMRNYLIDNILSKIKKSHLNGPNKKRLPNNINISIEGVEGEAMLINLDYFGIYCSTGSACSSSSLEPSHVLTAMKLPPEISHSSLRFSLGRWTKKKDLDYTIGRLISAVNRLRNISAIN